MTQLLKEVEFEPRSNCGVLACLATVDTRRWKGITTHDSVPPLL